MRYRTVFQALEAEQVLHGEPIKTEWAFEAMDKGVIEEPLHNEWLIRDTQGTVHRCSPELFDLLFEAIYEVPGYDYYNL